MSSKWAALVTTVSLLATGCVSSGSSGNPARPESNSDSQVAPIASADIDLKSPSRDESTWKPMNVPAYKPPPAPVKASARKSVAGSIVVIDAGHGGKDPGCKGLSPVWEKHITLGIAKELAAELRKSGVKVVMSRDSDSFIELDDRAALATRTRCDLFVSVHVNSLSDRSATGVEVYTSRSPSDVSRLLSNFIVASMRGNGIPVRGQRMSNFRVLVGHSRPAVLVECGYLTNSGESQSLNTSQYRSKVARALARGIENALAEI